MASAFDDFVPPNQQQSGGAFGDFKPPAAAPSSGGSIFTHVAADQPASFSNPSDPGLPSVASNPSDAGNLILAHLASLGKAGGQIGQTADDYVRAATNTFGLGDRFAAGMSNLTGVGGGDLAQQRATSAARAQADPVATTAGTIAGFGPLATQGIAAGLGGGVMGTAGELAAGGALAGAGKSQADTWSGMVKDALVGGVEGGVAGVPIGIAGKYVVNPIVNAVANKIGSVTGALSTPAEITASTEAAKKAAYDKFDDVLYHPSDIGNGVSDVKDGIYANDVDGNYRRNSPQTSKILDSYYDQMNTAAMTKQPTTGGTLNDTIKKLNGVAQKNPSNFEGVAAAQARDGLTDLFHTATPVSAPDNFNLDTALQDAANANKAYRNADFLEQARYNLKYFGQSPGGEAARIAQKYYPSGGADLEAGRPTQAAAAYKQLSNIALAGGGMPSAYSLMHAVYPMTEAAGAGLGSMVGGPAGAFAGEIAGGLAGGAMKTGVSSALSAAQKKAQFGALTGAYPDLTGQSTMFPRIDAGPALRALLFSQAPRPTS